MSAKNKKRVGEQCVSVSLSELLLLSQSANEFSLSDFFVRSVQSGQHSSRLFGRGMEFAECRRYQEGDDIRSIDWKVTARTGKMHTKLFTEEKERQVLICADMRSSMFFATKGVFKSVQAALLSGAIAWSAVKAGHRFGGLLFDDTKQDEFRPTPGKKGVLPFLQCLAEHLAIKSNRNSSVIAMDHAIESLKRLASPGSLIFVLSDFRKLSASSRDLLIQMSAHCDISLSFIYDPLEASLPKNGYYPVSDGKNELQLNTFDRKRLTEYQKQFFDRREKVFSLDQQRHIQFMECSTEDDCAQLLRELQRS